MANHERIVTTPSWPPAGLSLPIDCNDQVLCDRRGSNGSHRSPGGKVCESSGLVASGRTLGERPLSGRTRKQPSWKLDKDSVLWGQQRSHNKRDANGCSVGGARPLRRVLYSALTTTQLISNVACRAPFILVFSLLLLGGLLGVGTWGTLHFAAVTAHDSRSLATKFAMDVSNTVHNRHEVLNTATSALATFVKMKPNWSQLAKDFAYISTEIIASFSEHSGAEVIMALGLVPFGQVMVIFDGEEKRLMGDGGQTLDLFKMPATRQQALAGVVRASILLAGPFTEAPRFVLGDHVESQGPKRAFMIGALPVFFSGVDANETFGLPPGTGSFQCDLCYNATTRTMFWGFTGVIFAFQPERLAAMLTAHQFAFRLLDEQGAVLAAQDLSLLMRPVSVPVHMPHAVWTLELAPTQGWEPAWKAAMLAGVIVAACLVAGLTFGVLVSKQNHMWLLETMLPRNAITALQRGQGFYESFSCVTILFCDLVSFSSIVASLTPEEVVELLNEVYTMFDDLSAKHSCYKVETIGEQWMCVAGCPKREEAVAAACRTARLAQDMIAATQAFVSSHGHRIRIRCGMHSGPIVAAIIGSRMPRYALFGDTVNTAARFESNSDPMAVHISDATAALIRQADPHAKAFTVTQRGIVNIKGKGDMMCHWLHVPSEGLQPDQAHHSTREVLVLLESGMANRPACDIVGGTAEGHLPGAKAQAGSGSLGTLGSEAAMHAGSCSSC